MDNRRREKEMSGQERKRIQDRERMREQARKGYGGSICVDVLLSTQ